MHTLLKPLGHDGPGPKSPVANDDPLLLMLALTVITLCITRTKLDSPAMLLLILAYLRISSEVPRDFQITLQVLITADTTCILGVAITQIHQQASNCHRYIYLNSSPM